ncbi:MAG: NAD-glutamate dehydrogenase, partial [Nevskiaceae bacterium]
MNNEAASNQELDVLLSRIEALAARRVDKPDQPLFRAFVRHYFEMASAETLKLRPTEDLLEAALAHFQQARTRKRGEVLIEVKPPQDPAAAGSHGFATVRTVVDDMSFLYDSVGMAVREAGVSIDWTVHPVLRVMRERGKLTEVLGVAGTGDDGDTESLIHVECEGLARPEDYPVLERRLRDVIGELTQCVQDYPALRKCVQALVKQLDSVPKGADAAEFREAQDFLRWLDEGRFTFLGYSQSRVGTSGFDDVRDAALGLLRPGGRFEDTQEYIAPREELSKYATSKRVVVVSKGNVRSPLHHPEYFDVVSVKHFGADGEATGVSRFVGLFATEVYTARVREIPLLRRKAEYVMQRARLPEASHSGKNLREIIHSLPRDELFQSSETELFQLCMGIRALRDRHQLRLFMRRDRYGRYYTCMVYLPRDRYSAELRDRIATELTGVFGATSIDRTVEFLRGSLARILYTVRTEAGTTVSQTPAEVEQRLLAVTRSWREQLREVFRPHPVIDGAAMAARFGDAFPVSYTSSTTAEEAAADVEHLIRLSATDPVLPRLAAGTGGSGTLKLYSYGKPIPLSDVLPTLENFGLRVIWQDPTEV